jgi:hypothetical protein
MIVPVRVKTIEWLYILPMHLKKKRSLILFQERQGLITKLFLCNTLKRYQKMFQVKQFIQNWILCNGYRRPF